MALTSASLKRLRGVHPDLIAVAEAGAARVATTLPGTTIQITEGLRTLARQRALVKQGASRTLKSRHLTGDAFDFAVFVKGRLTWAFPAYARVAAILKDVAKEKGIAIEWGGDWTSFRDGPHVQRPWSAGTHQPATGTKPAPAPAEPLPHEINLVIGSVGPRVQDLQRALAGLGHAVAVDGDFGPMTERAVRAAQAALGKPATGIVDHKTLLALQTAAWKRGKGA
jgi:peptidoglycan L-alanyl-D-glutamate endopeptidase CwlK